MKLRAVVCALLAMILLLPVFGCTQTPGNGAETETELPSGTQTEEITEERAVPENAILLYDGKQFCLPVVVSEQAPKSVRSAAVGLVTSLGKLLPGGNLPDFKDDFTKDPDSVAGLKNEILVGDTNRPASIDARNATYVDYTFSVEVNADRVVIAGIDSAKTVEAITYFAETFLPTHLLREDGKLYLLPGTYRGERTDASFISYAVAANRSGIDFRYETKKILDVAPLTSYGVQQGACLDTNGDYFYFILEAATDNGDICSLVKYDAHTLTQVAVNENIGCYHGNDVAYNPNNKTVVVSHCTGTPTYLSVFNAETLELIKRVDTGFSNSAIDYCPERGLYVMMGGGYFRYLDEDFRVVDQYPTKATPYTSQGIHCDERYIYRVESGSSANNVKGNIIEVYDWEGNYVLKMELPDITIEGETLAHLGKDLYVICNVGKKRGGRVYQMTILSEVE